MENLVFCGGGSKIYALVGVLEVLEERGYLDSFFRCAGSSSGGLIASLWAVGANAKQIKQICLDQDLSEYSKNFLENNILEGAMRLMGSYGYYDSGNVADWVHEIYETRLGVRGETTFKEAFDLTGREVVITATNLNKQRTAYFSHRTSPNLAIKTAVQMTISIPFYFTCVQYKGDYYVDGGMLCNYPIHVFNRADPEMEKTLSFMFLTDNDKTGHFPINGFMDFLDSIIDCAIEHSSNSHLKDEKFKKYIMMIDVGDHAARSIGIDQETRRKLVKKGRSEAKKWLETHNHLFSRHSSQHYKDSGHILVSPQASDSEHRVHNHNGRVPSENHISGPLDRGNLEESMRSFSSGLADKNKDMTTPTEEDNPEDSTADIPPSD